MFTDTMRISDCSIRNILYEFLRVGNYTDACNLVLQHPGLLSGLGPTLCRAKPYTEYADSHPNLFSLISNDIRNVILGRACSISLARHNNESSTPSDLTIVNYNAIRAAQLQDEDVQILHMFLKSMESEGATELLSYLSKLSYFNHTIRNMGPSVRERHQKIENILACRSKPKNYNTTKSAAARNACV